jgi:hypothetical protein
VPTAFHWITFDVRDLLPHLWQHDAIAVAHEADFRDFPRTPLISREGPKVATISRGRVHADGVRRRLPWLYEFYHGQFRKLISEEWPEPVYPAADDRYGVVLNVQRGTGMRFESHLDSNPVSALLFFTDHPAGGGELAVAHDLTAADIDSIDRDCSVIQPQAGHLVFFDGRDRAHYARPLRTESDMRVLAVMNYYTDSCPESARPRELNHHLYGDPL